MAMTNHGGARFRDDASRCSPRALAMPRVALTAPSEARAPGSPPPEAARRRVYARSMHAATGATRRRTRGNDFPAARPQG
eukprot:15281817-Alexandrium_andersonii.AAC.1